MTYKTILNWFPETNGAPYVPCICPVVAADQSSCCACGRAVKRDLLHVVRRPRRLDALFLLIMDAVSAADAPHDLTARGRGHTDSHEITSLYRTNLRQVYLLRRRPLRSILQIPEGATLPTIEIRNRAISSAGGDKHTRGNTPRAHRAHPLTGDSRRTRKDNAPRRTPRQASPAGACIANPFYCCLCRSAGACRRHRDPAGCTCGHCQRV